MDKSWKKDTVSCKLTVSTASEGCVATESASVFKGAWGRCPQQAVYGYVDSHKHCLPQCAILSFAASL